jgi:hypothetical protein
MKRILLSILVCIGLQSQAQINPCDSIWYNTSNTANYALGINAQWTCAGGYFYWYIESNNMIFTDTGNFVTFSYNQINLTDTIEVCYDFITTMGNPPITYTCYDCDSLAYDSNTQSWMALSMIPHPVSINELEISLTNNNKIYDLTGKELNSIPTKGMYIRNRKLYLTH